ncbi:putative sulfate/molybdate transporter [Siccirubricoccus sp. KC 17139]|uniref:Sulfate/molybdate transporter n=1 Tax=Siccirubricoccus soli TaxID=2899147 RepID=A0ABT1D2K9_9PROT|nr:putative sulfate/molybdate transporter [Siccirubricoccus soli]MCO6416146.1 putative sulfate/molybdate transporter [Siccirubricoccus soli]MCP2682280.1 putative sulfate/molybdate transporter [Siccirubricoccus soli]
MAMPGQDLRQTAEGAKGHGRVSWPGELGGACGDLGTFVPLVVGAMTVAGLAPAGVLVGFGVFLMATGLAFGIPLAVQPMKAVSAVLLTGGLGPGELVATGLVTGAVLLALGVTGAIGWVARAVPKSVAAGLQLGLGLAMAWLGLKLIVETPWLGGLALLALLGLMRLPRVPAAPLALVLAFGIAWAAGLTQPPALPAFSFAFPSFHLPGSWGEVWRGILSGVMPQLPLTLTNAVILTALLARELYPDHSQRITEQRLAVGTGLANLLLAPLGAMPMCLGAGGLQAQHRFGARTGAAPVLLGVVLLVLGLCFAEGAAALFAAVPAGAIGALLLVAGSDLALSRRLFDARPDCWPAIGVAAALTVLVNPAAGLAAGCTIEAGRSAAKRLLSRNMGRVPR